MKIKQMILEGIKQQGISHVFMVPGGLIDPFLATFDLVPGITPIVAAQEGGAAYMADGFARASGLFGVCLCIGGPGATNTVTPLMAAKSDASPLLLITGEVSTSMEGMGVFQDASMQAADDFDVLRPVTKYSVSVKRQELFMHHFREVLSNLFEHIPAPVHLCVPTDIQEAEITDVPPDLAIFTRGYALPLDQEAARTCLDKLSCDRIALLVGHGLHTDRGAQALIAFSERTGIPVATTLRAKGIFPENHPLSLGVFGYAGSSQATQALLHSNLDTLLVLGSGLNQRDSMNWSLGLVPEHLVVVNQSCDAIAANFPRASCIESDCTAFLEWLNTEELSQTSVRQQWVKEIKSGPWFYDAQNLQSDAIPIHPARVVHELRKVAPADTVLLVDSGAHRAFCGHYWQAYAPQHYLSATNLGPMGWAIPAGIGAKLARPKQPCCVVTGDGGRDYPTPVQPFNEAKKQWSYHD